MMSNLITLVEIARAVEEKMAASMVHIGGISLGEFRLLRAIDQAGEHCLTRVELAQAVGLTPSGVSRALKPLEKIGMLESAKAERDARQTRARLTPAGQEAVQNCQTAIEEMLETLPPFPVRQEVLDAYWTQLMTPRPRNWKHKTNGAFLARSLTSKPTNV